MLDSLGIGELGLILVVALLFIDPSKIGTLARGFATLRRKWNNVQRDIRQQFDTLTLEENLRDSAEAVRAAKAALRREAVEVVRALPAAERAAAAEAALAVLNDWPAWREAASVALFCGTRDEIDTEPMVRAALAAGKEVYLPRVLEGPAGAPPTMELVRVRDFDRDLEEGAFAILEPRRDLSGSLSGSLPGTPGTPGAPESADGAPAGPALYLVPGTAFDERGGRVGRGKGYYDRFLEGKTGLRAGLAFEAQILRKKLPLEPHDQLLDALVTERRVRNFAAPRAD